ncbi:hypothetical protein EXN66_Car009629 [Channa argus]|uniref:Uncharacterized protein n=1 Tax=Channa argus TaxID=215402 RepID=A0A6G1PUU1_CHAAH|nr:hypothetical protein EXN66_Car009629 [Channa argus]
MNKTIPKCLHCLELVKVTLIMHTSTRSIHTDHNLTDKTPSTDGVTFMSGQ